ncbi:non-homologous end-joining DNA ligase [Actinospongicola halichondriae]|uniref:non-homologous end-joining DNA ligase n=1 Tax=Actinospongicola halichondriae TaxID=3236844 RepID=UPI003D4EF34E
MTPLPMKATSGPLPVSDEWLYEIKWDGMRLVVTIDDGGVRLTSATGNDATASYPELVGLTDALGVESAVLDGEVVAFDDRGRPDFGRLQQRMHVSNPRQAAERAAAVPAVLCLFDLLALDGRDVTGLPLVDRRRLLEHLVEPGAHWQVPDAHDDGRALLDAADAAGLEGVVAKRRDSTYRPGSRTKDWVKVKIRRRQEFVVGGWGAGDGGRAGRIGGLLVGYHEPAGGPLRFAGRVGSGLSDREIDVLTDLFVEREASPFDPLPPANQLRGVTWVEPEVVVEVEYAEWTSEGRLRHPTYAGRRIDVDPSEVTATP